MHFIPDGLNTDGQSQVQFVFIIGTERKSIFSLVTVFFHAFGLGHNFSIMEDRVIVAEIRIFFILVPVDQVTLISQIAAERIQFVGGIISAACGQYVQQRGGGVPDHLIGFSVEIIQIGIIDTEIDAFPVEVGRIKSEYSSQISQLERIIFRTIVGSLGVGKI